MRPLKEEEFQKIEGKLRQYMGNNLGSFLNPVNELVYHDQRVYYARKDLIKKASMLARESIMCIGTCMGRFTKTGSFRIKITALHMLMTYASAKVKVKQTSEMNVLYGNHVQRAHLCNVAPDIKKNAGVVLTTSSSVPIGFGLMTKSASEIVAGDRTAIVVVRHGDTGEYLRDESALM
ncbi:60S ribosome subunit biogenesis protein NIP7 [Nematocida major]|uniref:60S ribosome subunit biogenesis protein NIP7 n=1 Tax=Nematocida major TaxID=1912982 RepID=UPI002008A33B|nr:60S ribosome subunit biogenesis protein NIP7 [Nematocida major]KAH9386855.1 60S ribosome subunit biogenesis protein NIP7 [Nematocida major]